MQSPQPSVTTTFRSSSEQAREHPPINPTPSEPRSQALDVAMRLAATTCYVASDMLSFAALHVGEIGDRIRSRIPGLEPWMPTGEVMRNEKR